MEKIKKFKYGQMVKIVDENSFYNGCVGSVIEYDSTLNEPSSLLEVIKGLLGIEIYYNVVGYNYKIQISPTKNIWSKEESLELIEK